jgi:hypothetical protein
VQKNWSPPVLLLSVGSAHRPPRRELNWRRVSSLVGRRPKARSSRGWPRTSRGPGPPIPARGPSRRASRPAGSLRAPRRPRRPAATGRAGTPGRARPQGLLRASRCGRPRRGGKRPAPVTKPGRRADQTRTSRSSQAALIHSDERSVGPHHDRLRSADRTEVGAPGPSPAESEGGPIGSRAAASMTAVNAGRGGTGSGS